MFEVTFLLERNLWIPFLWEPASAGERLQRPPSLFKD